MNDHPDPDVPPRARRPWWRGFFPLFGALLLLVFLLPHAPMALRWPIRIVIAGLAALLVPLFLQQSISIVGGLAGWCNRLAVPAQAFFSRHARVIRRIELAAASILIAIAAVHVLQVMGSMTSASLKTDEIGSIMKYSSKGPHTCVLSYDLAKNHIFFSLVNSLTPGAGSYHPLRARLWSFVAVAAALVLLVHTFFRRGEYLAGAIAFALPAANSYLLNLLLEARGYGFIALAGVVCLVALERYLETGSRKALAVLGIATALGTWTLPFFIAFAGPILLILFLHERNRTVFLAGWFTISAILVLYAPVAHGVFNVATTYDEEYGVRFDSFRSLGSAMRYCLPPRVRHVETLQLLSGICAILLLPFCFNGLSPRRRTVMRISFGMVCVFLAFCFFLQTPPFRVTSFLGLPFAFAAGLLAALVIGSQSLVLARPVLTVAGAAFLSLSAVHDIKTYEFRLNTRWREGGQIIRSMFPPGTKAQCPNYDNMLGAYLGDGYPMVIDLEPDWSKLRNGTLVLFDPSHKSTHTPIGIPAGKQPRDLEQIILPNATTRQVIYFVPPDGPALAAMTLDGQELPPAEAFAFAPGQTLSVTLDASAAPYSLNLLADARWPELGSFDIIARAPDGSTRRLPARRITSIETALSVRLDNIPPGAVIQVQWKAKPESQTVPVNVRRIWAAAAKTP